MNAGPPNTRELTLGQEVVPAPLQQVVDDIVNLVPKDKQGQAKERVLQIVTTLEEFRGMMPHPDHAERYENICPGTFDRMLRMREEELFYTIERDRKEQEHARTWENKDQSNANFHTVLALSLGSAIGFSLVLAAVYCAAIGQPWIGAALVATSAVSMVPAILNGRRDRGGRRDNPNVPVQDSARKASTPVPRDGSRAKRKQR